MAEENKENNEQATTKQEADVFKSIPMKLSTNSAHKDEYVETRKNSN